MKTNSEPWFKGYKRLYQDLNIFSGKPRLRVIYDTIRANTANRERVEIKSGRFKVKLKKGQCLISNHELKKQSGGRTSSIKNDLLFLEQSGLIIVKKIGQYMLIQDTNYENFASDNFDVSEIYMQISYDNVTTSVMTMEDNLVTMSQPKQKNTKEPDYDNVIEASDNVTTKKLQCNNPIVTDREIYREIKEMVLVPQMSREQNFDFPPPDDSKILIEIDDQEIFDLAYQNDQKSIMTDPIDSSMIKPLTIDDIDFADSSSELDISPSDQKSILNDLDGKVDKEYRKTKTSHQKRNSSVSRKRKVLNKKESIKAHDPKLIDLAPAFDDRLIRAHDPAEVAEFVEVEVLPPDGKSGQVKKSRSRKKKTDTDSLLVGAKIVEKSDGARVFEAYNEAIEKRYSHPATRNAMINSLCSQLVKRLGVEDAIKIVKFYVSHNNKFYVQNLHMLKFAVADAEKLIIEANKGFKMNSKMAQQNELYQTNLENIERYFRNKEAAEKANKDVE